MFENSLNVSKYGNNISDNFNMEWKCGSKEWRNVSKFQVSFLKGRINKLINSRLCYEKIPLHVSLGTNRRSKAECRAIHLGVVWMEKWEK